jgi:hypothetical protein
MTTQLEKLGQLLLRQGLLSPEQLALCLRESGTAPGHRTEAEFSDLVVSRGFIDRETMNRALRSLDGPAWVSIADPEPAGKNPVPPEVLEARKDPKRVMQKYTLLAELGRGGMAVVYKAWDDSLKAYVALKLIRTQDIGIADTSQESEVQEFLREARTAIKLSHPHIVRVFELGRDGDRYYLSMEYVEGKNLDAMLHPSRRQPPWQEFFASPRRFLVILRDVATALHHAHTQTPSIVHRDVKPQNILVDGNGRACVVDFGLAKEMKSGSTLTVSGIVKGTPCYMAPEQALGGSGKGIDARTDVWALGAILYEYLTGTPPFTGPTQREILNKVVNDELVPPSVVHRGRGSGVQVPSGLEKICLKALEKDKEKRYRSANEFAREMDRYLGGGTVRARGVSGYERVWRRAIRHKAVVLSVAGAVLMGILALVALLRKSEPQRIVEKVVVESAADARMREASEKIRSIASEMQFEKARRAYQELSGGAPAGKEKEALKGEMEEIRLQEALIADLTASIRERPRTYPRFSLKDRTLENVRLLDSSSDVLIVRHADRGLEIPWGQVAVDQFTLLAVEGRASLGADATLGFISWCLQHKRPDVALATAESLRGKPGEATAKRLLAKSGMELVPARAPEPLSKEPEASPAPKEAPVTPLVETPKPEPSAPVENPPPAPGPWEYRWEWKIHGMPLAAALLRRGWDDLAEELVLNQLHAPRPTDLERDEAVLVRARLWASQAAREPMPQMAGEKLAWAIKTLEGLLGRSIDREVRLELASLYGAKGRSLLQGGNVAQATAIFTALEANSKARVEQLERESGGMDKARKEEWLNAKLSQALAIFAQAELFRSVRDRAAAAKPLYQRLVAFLDGDVLWELEGTAAGAHAHTLRAVALFCLERWPEAQSSLDVANAWLEDPALRSGEAGRWILPRFVLTEMRLKAPPWPSAPGDESVSIRYGRLAKRGEELFKKLPQTREGEIGQLLRLELARAYARSGKGPSAVAELKSLVSVEGGPTQKAAAARILKELGTPEALTLLRDLNVAPAEADLPTTLDFLQAIPPAGGTVGPPFPGRSFGGRLWDAHTPLLARNGGTAVTDASVLSALRWLARHQSAGGQWEADKFMDQCKGGACGGTGNPEYDVFSQTVLPTPGSLRKPNDCGPAEEERSAPPRVNGDSGATGLALLAFLGAGFGPQSKEEYLDRANPGRSVNFGANVRSGLQWLMSQQDPEGCLGERGMRYMFNHLISGLALVEAYGMTGSPRFKNAAQKAVDFAVAAQNPGKGWRYSAKCGDNDTAVTGWAVQLLRAAELAELTFPKTCVDGALSWLNEATETNGYYQVGYNARSTGKLIFQGLNESFDHHATMSAVGLLSRLVLQGKRKGEPALVAWNLLVADLPEWKVNKIDFYYWHFSTMAMFCHDGPDGLGWKKWNEPLKNLLVYNQRGARDGCRSGSWDPENDRWGALGGRVYATAINALTLETYYRYAPILEPRKK